MNAGTWLGAVAGTAVLALVLVLSASLEPGEPREPDVASIPSATVPTPEATFPPGPVLSGPITLYEAPERVQRIQLDPGEAVGERGFFYFWDVETGAVDGWGPPGNPEFSTPMFDAVSSDSRFLARIRSDEDFLLVDRESGTVYSYNQSEGWPVTVAGEDYVNTLVTHEDHVLFYMPAGDLAVIDFAGDKPHVASRFKYPEDLLGVNRHEDYFQTLFSPDGSQIALIAEDVRLFDVETGDATVIDDRPLADQSLGQFARRRLQRSADGTFIVDVLDAGFETGALGWARYDWEGTLLGSGRVENASRAGAKYSPDGEHVAWTQSYLGDYTITALVVSDLTTGETRFRVLGLQTCESCDWLDAETAYARTQAELAPQTYGATVTLDGTITPQPRFPTRIDQSLGEIRLLDEEGGVAATLNLDWNGVRGLTQGSLAWDQERGIVRFATPTLGRDSGGAPPMPIQPELELPPFADTPTGTLTRPPLVSFQPSELFEEPDRESKRLGSFEGAYAVEEDLRLTNPDSPWLIDDWSRVEREDGPNGWVVTTQYERSLRANPGKRGEVVRLLDYPVRVTFLETLTVGQPGGESPDAYWPGGEVWARVRLSDGTEGWILLHAYSYL